MILEFDGHGRIKNIDALANDLCQNSDSIFNISFNLLLSISPVDFQLLKQKTAANPTLSSLFPLFELCAKDQFEQAYDLWRTSQSNQNKLTPHWLGFILVRVKDKAISLSETCVTQIKESLRALAYKDSLDPFDLPKVCGFLWRLEATKGNAVALNNLAYLIETEEITATSADVTAAGIQGEWIRFGPKKPAEQAAELYCIAALKGCPLALSNIAALIQYEEITATLAHFEAAGIEDQWTQYQDKAPAEQAAALYCIAALKGRPTAMRDLACLIDVEEITATSVHFKAAGIEDQWAQYQSKAPAEQAAALYCIAALKGDAVALRNIAALIQNKKITATSAHFEAAGIEDQWAQYQSKAPAEQAAALYCIAALKGRPTASNDLACLIEAKEITATSAHFKAAGIEDQWTQYQDKAPAEKAAALYRIAALKGCSTALQHIAALIQNKKITATSAHFKAAGIEDQWAQYQDKAPAEQAAALYCIAALKGRPTAMRDLACLIDVEEITATSVHFKAAGIEDQWAQYQSKAPAEQAAALYRAYALRSKDTTAISLALKGEPKFFSSADVPFLFFVTEHGDHQERDRAIKELRSLNHQSSAARLTLALIGEEKLEAFLKPDRKLTQETERKTWLFLVNALREFLKNGYVRNFSELSSETPKPSKDLLAFIKAVFEYLRAHEALRSEWRLLSKPKSSSTLFSPGSRRPAPPNDFTACLPPPTRTLVSHKPPR